MAAAGGLSGTAGQPNSRRTQAPTNINGSLTGGSIVLNHHERLLGSNKKPDRITLRPPMCTGNQHYPPKPKDCRGSADSR